VIYVDASGRRVATSGRTKRFPLPPAKQRVYTYFEIVGPAPPLYNSVIFSFSNPDWPSGSFQYEYISPNRNWGIVVENNMSPDFGRADNQFVELVFFNRYVRNDPTVVVLKS
jgi:hypothetical protein